MAPPPHPSQGLLTSPKAPLPITFKISKSPLCRRSSFTFVTKGLAEGTEWTQSFLLGTSHETKTGGDFPRDDPAKGHIGAKAHLVQMNKHGPDSVDHLASEPPWAPAPSEAQRDLPAGPSQLMLAGQVTLETIRIPPPPLVHSLWPLKASQGPANLGNWIGHILWSRKAPLPFRSCGPGSEDPVGNLA